VVLLNLDAGEDPSETDALWSTADLLCVACGGHAGDAASMTRVVTFCASRKKPRLGAHPSYPDRESFGRRSMVGEMAPVALARALSAQLRKLSQIAAAHGTVVGWVKPHGALYHDASAEPALAALVIDTAITVLGSTIQIIGPPTGALREATAQRNLIYLCEGFADRATRPDGSLVPRSEPGALITDPAVCAARARELHASGDIDTICVHADTPSSLAIAAAVRNALDELQDPRREH
jgi:5-oxoprolinase (ATP-hydrolysing) subunit A